MKRTRSLSWLLLLTLLVTCLLPMSGLAGKNASPSVSGSNSASGNSGQFPSSVNMTFELSGADGSSPYPTVAVRVKDSGGTYQDVGTVSTKGDGSYGFKISSGTLNKLSVGTAKVLASAPSAGSNNAIDETSIGKIEVQAVAYTITMQATEGGTASATLSTAMPGEGFMIEAKNEAGYYFVNWTILKGDFELRKVGVASQAMNMPEGDIVLRANFRSNSGKNSSDGDGSSGSSSSSGTQTSSSQWTTSGSDAIPNYTPVMVDARNMPITGTVIADSAPIYSAPLAGTSSAGAFAKDDALTMLGYDNGYFAVLVGSRTMGYVYGDETKFTFDPGLNATLLQATTASGEAGGAPSLPTGSPVLVTGRDGANWLISSGGQSYSLPANGSNGLPTLSISAEDLTAVAGSYTFPTVGTVRDGGVKIRASATTSSSQLGSLASGATFTAVGYDTNFMVIQRTTGEIGYVQADYVNVTFSPPLYGTVLMNAAAYTRGVSESRYFLKTVPVDTVASLQGREGSWWRVTVEGETMWIKAENINVPTIK